MGGGSRPAPILRIAAPTRAGGVRDTADWAAIQHALLADLQRLEAALRPYLRLAGLDQVGQRGRSSWLRQAGTWSLGTLIKRTECWTIAMAGVDRVALLGPPTTPNVMVFSDPRTGRRYGYLDRWEGPIFHYVGEGQVGDQNAGLGNKAILEHAERGKALRIFKGVRGVVRYEGEYGLEAVEPRYFAEARDRNGDLRKVVVFRMRPIDGGVPVSVAIPDAVSGLCSGARAIGSFGAGVHTSERSRKRRSA